MTGLGDWPDDTLDTLIGRCTDKGLVVLNLDGCPVYVNPAFEAMTGRSRRAWAASEDGEGDDVSVQRIRKAFARVAAGQHLRKTRIDLQRADGAIAVDVVSSPIYDQEERLCGYTVWFHDITGHVQTEQDLRSTHDRLRMLVQAIEQSGDGIGIIDVHGNHVFQNQALSRMSGYSAEELSRDATILWQDPEEVRETVIPAALSGETWRGTLTVQHKGGWLYPCVLTTSPMYDRDGKLSGVVSIHHDISQQRSIEAQVRYQSLLFDQISDAVISSTLDGKIAFWNQGAAKIWGWKLNEVIGRDIRMLYAPEEQAGFESDIATLQTDKHLENERRCVTKDGREMLVHNRMNIVTDSWGEQIGMVSVSHDVTAQRERERQEAYQVSVMQGVIENAPIGISVLDPQGIVLAINHAHLRIFHMPDRPAATVGSTAFTPIVKQNKLDGLFRELLRGKSFALDDYPFTTRDGIQIYVNVRGVPLGIDSLPHGLVLVQDVTARHQYEARLADEVAYHEMMSALSNLALQSNTLEEFAGQSLRMIGTRLSASRAYMFVDDPRAAEAVRLHEWCAAGVEPRF
jgi:PAS domain S-box-containing protein